MNTIKTVLFLLLFLASVTSTADEDPYTDRRSEMVKEVRNYAKAAINLGDPPLDEVVLQALDDVKRHEFVPRSVRMFAYENRPLPIGHGQTISQPYIVALMTDLIDLAAGDVVLEVGTGSGYQAAILSGLVERVYTIEIIPALAENATERLKDLGYDNVSTRLGDGYFGWQDNAPFDAIIVTAAASHVPPPLVKQLKPGGRMAIPVGDPFTVQRLLLVEKTEDGEIFTQQIAAVSFVPLTGKH